VTFWHSARQKNFEQVLCVASRIANSTPDRIDRVRLRDGDGRLLPRDDGERRHARLRRASPRIRDAIVDLDDLDEGGEGVVAEI
jgi:hypothetical protein|tara:strand:- start:276 stop:527 length:252 start_codon:yes stop_codon:yes gene_type:complete